MADYFIEQNIAFIVLNNPPVNVLSIKVRINILKHFEAASSDDSVKAIVFRSKGKHFCAGADISEFKTGLVFENFIAFIFNDIEQCSKPVFALVHGNAFGGGFELALACHYRIAAENAFFALPEVKLGILPAAGGSQRLPRLIGLWHAADLILSGRSISAAEALSKGVIDHLVPLPENSENFEISLQRSCIEFVKARLNQFSDKRRICNLPFEPLNSFFYKQIEQSVLKKSKGMDAPLKIFSLLKKSVGLDFKNGQKLEQKTLGELINGTQTKALQHLFFAERALFKFPSASNPLLLPINSIGVIGAGTMGTGIAINFLEAHFSVVLVEQNEKQLQKGVELIKTHFQRKEKMKKMASAMVKKKIALLKGSTDSNDLSSVDLVIEAVFEDLKLKMDILSNLDKICKKDALLCTNTSTLDIDKIAEATSRKDKVMGMHFFAPANVMKLLEAVKGAATSEKTVLNVMNIAKRIKKTPVLVGNCFGFVANRMLLAYMSQAFQLLNEGCLPSEIDKALEDFGFVMGPLKVCDLSGIDIINHIKKSYLNSFPDTKEKHLEIFTVSDKLFELKRLGVKSGRGFYKYKKGSPKGEEDAEMKKILAENSGKRGGKKSKKRRNR